MFVRKRPKTRASNTKVTTYVRDIICLPKDYTTADRIVIPRGERRSILAQNGLVSKLQFDSGMSAEEVHGDLQCFFEANGAK